MEKLKMYAVSVRVLTAVCLCLLCGFGCEKDPEPFPVDFEYRLLNPKGEVTTTFKQGEDITFSFLITNKDPSLTALYNFVLEMNSPNSGFCKVYQIVEGQGEIYWGVAGCLSDLSYEFIGIYPLGKVGIPKEIKYQWLRADEFCNAPNKPLTKGKYKTGFTQTFYLNNGKRMIDSEHTTRTFEINFEVK
jgi:hypothetical protein